MKKQRSIKTVTTSDFVNMGPIRLRQPIPTVGIDKVDPFILLHHYGPYKINTESNPFDLGPHPHRGFEPITFLLKGEQLHRDSLGNESVVKAGDVQWTTAGRGVIHAEGPTKAFVENGGELEGIQLWLNLPKSHKMMPANYQHVKNEEIPIIKSKDNKTIVRIVSGELEGKKGLIKTQTPVNSFMVDIEKRGEYFVNIHSSHQALVYLLDGEVLVNHGTTLMQDANQMIVFNNDGDGFTISANGQSKLLVLSGEPLNEPVANWGPYVMNTQTEIMEAMRDYQQGKMGFLAG